MMNTLMEMFNESDVNNDTYLSMEELEHFVEDVNSMDGDEMLDVDYIVSYFDEDNDSKLSREEFTHMMSSEEHDDDHDDNGTHDEEEEMMEQMIDMMFNMSDNDGDGFLSADELNEMFEAMDEDDHEGHADAYAILHIEEEGDYGVGLPSEIEFEIVALSEEEHDHGDHDDHGDDHDDHDDHGDDHDDHDDHGDDHDDHDDHGDEEGAAYDPHSWLDPVAFDHQLGVVLEILVNEYPGLEDTFRANAAAFSDELDNIDAGFEAAFGENGTCVNNLVVANHNAYSYMANRYNIDFVTVHGLDPEGEPSLEDISEVVEQIEDKGLTVLFVEEYTQPSAVSSIVAQTVSDDLPNGVSIEYLYTMEMAPSDSSQNYITLMNSNLDNLMSGLNC